MSLRERINEDMKAAMRARESARLATIRLLLAAIKQKEVDERVVLEDGEVIAVIEKMLKQRRDSISQYEAAQRQDLADAERFEAELLGTYMPAGLSDAEIDAALTAAIIEACGDKTPAQGDMGKIMTAVKPRIAGRADMAEVSRRIKARLAGA